MYEVRKLHNYKPKLIISIIPTDCTATFYTLLLAISCFRSSYESVSIWSTWWNMVDTEALL
jgi:hypothetical protein